MKLFFTPMAGYIHRVEIVVIETGHFHDMELIPTTPWEDPEALIAANPIAIQMAAAGRQTASAINPTAPWVATPNSSNAACPTANTR